MKRIDPYNFMKNADPDNTYDESTNPSNGWRTPEAKGIDPEITRRETKKQTRRELM